MSAISLLLLSLFLSHLPILTAQPSALRYGYCFNNGGNYTNTSSYQSNFNTLVSEINSNTENDYGFYNLSHGQPPDRVSIIGLCGGYVKPSECRSCLNNALMSVPKSCPNQKEAMGGYDECFLRYSNRSILGGVMEDNLTVSLYNRYKAIDQEKFNQVAGELLHELRDKAASGDSLRKFAAATKSSANDQTVYAAVQCTPDLSHKDCSDCLMTAISELPYCCSTAKGGTVIEPSCNIRYENYRFYNNPLPDDASPSPSPSSLPPPKSISEGNGKKSNITLIAVMVPVAAIILLLILIIIYFKTRKPREAIQTESETDDGDIEFTEALQLDFETIRIATDNFADANKLGQGGFGPVYKGKLQNGEEVAVKRLSINSGQGDKEFKNEVTWVAKLQHRNLVRLLGFCMERGERLLVYEFLPNKSLDYKLFDPDQRAQLDWVMRHKIIEGVARGLHYLHEDSRLRIIHRDLKASNILLDRELNSKISDFGMARLLDQTQNTTNRIVGTYRYMAPEYAMHGQFSVKSDVFSFGVIILEIVSGKKNNSIFDEENVQNLLGFAWKNWREETASNIIDPLLNIGSRDEIMKFIHIGLLCVQENVAERPTMASVALMLSSNSLTLPIPSEPPFMCNGSLPEMNSWEYRSSEATRSTDEGGRGYVVEASINEVSVTELHPR